MYYSNDTSILSHGSRVCFLLAVKESIDLNASGDKGAMIDLYR